MTISFLHAIWTVLLLGVFAGIVYWAYRSSNRARFEEASRIPLEDEGEERAPRAGGVTKIREFSERTDV